MKLDEQRKVLLLCATREASKGLRDAIFAMDELIGELKQKDRFDATQAATKLKAEMAELRMNVELFISAEVKPEL